uniref:N/A n=1 Tax=Ganoderma boninense TaxID=34458 RepID=A0A5K1JXC0_9APHY|nr:N/A [Ganoderma boninense]
MPSRSSSAAALNNLLNAEPTRSPVAPVGSHGSPGGLGGLEALVQAATEERRRISGEHPTPLEARESARRASLSPVLNRVPPPLPRPSQSPVLQKSPMASSPRDTRVNSLAVISLGHDGEPPTKKRRRTGSFGSSASRIPPVAPPHKAHPTNAPNLPSPSAPPYQHTDQQPAEPTTPVTSQPPVSSTKPRSIAQLLSPGPRSKEPLLGSQSASKPPSPSPYIPPSQSRSLVVDDSQHPQQPIPSDEQGADAEAVVVIPQHPVLECQEELKPVGCVEEQAQAQGAKIEVEIEAVELEVKEPRIVSPAIMEEELPIRPAEEDRHDVSMSSPPVVQGKATVPPIQVGTEAAVLPIEVEKEVVLPPMEGKKEAIAPPIEVEAAVISIEVEEGTPVPLVEVEVEEPQVMAPTDRLLGPTANVAAEPTAAPTTVEESKQRAASPITMALEELTSLSEAVAVEEDVSGLTTGPTSISEAAHHFEGELVLGVLAEPQHPNPMHEDDAHEWLLEHYASSTPTSRHLSAAPEEPPQTPDLSDAPSPPPLSESFEEMPKRPSSPHSQPPLEPSKRPQKNAPRSPTPTSLLEQEVDGIVAGSLPASVPSPHSDTDTDFALELDLAASANPSADTDPDISMGNDFDDELLSLVDDKPHHHPSSSQNHSHFHPHPQSHSQSHHVAIGKASQSASSVVIVEKELLLKEPVDKKPVPQSPPPMHAASVALTPSERVVMPPPIAPPQIAKPATPQVPAKADQPSDGTSLPMSTGTKKDSTAKQPRSKQLAKPKAKPQPKPKVKPTKEKEGTAEPSGRLTPSGNGMVVKSKKPPPASVTSAGAAAKRAVSAATGPSRSRSASEMPMPAEPAAKSKTQPQEEEESGDEAVDDKLYCICKTNYDEDKVMIACDRCDEWYHTQCLDMDDLEVDLIDQFVCPLCIKANPNLPLKTTYKQRCIAGLKHPHPTSAAACHKPARGAFSKFCSDECGVLYMQRRIQDWGGNKEALWASIRDTKQREGVVVRVHVNGTNGVADGEQTGRPVHIVAQESYEVQRPTHTQRDRAVVRLQAELEKIAPKREELKQEHDVISWRQKVLELAAARADRVDECGWDQRLIFDEEEYLEFGDGVLESYEERSPQLNGAAEESMQVDGACGHGEWWCRGKKKCQRHAGWQKLRASEIECDLTMNRKSMQEVTNQEREIRKKLEDTTSTPLRTVMPGSFQPLNGRHFTNGIKSKPNGTSGKKGKQRH